jgi:hypothetical protein
MYNKIIEYLLDIGAIGIGAKRVEYIENKRRSNGRRCILHKG